jgi:hypothetical protein
MMTEDKTHRPDDDTCEHCESQQPTALQRAFAAAMALLQRTVVIRSIVLGGTAFLTVVWFQLTSVRRRESTPSLRFLNESLRSDLATLCLPRRC